MSTDTDEITEKAILFDSSHCTACKGCQVACKCWNNLPSPTGLNECVSNFTGSYQNPPDINGDTRIIITFDEEAGGSKGVEWAFGRRSCQHCTDAPCATVCPSGALEVTEWGFVTVHDEKCIGCHYCQAACPFDVPQYYGDKAIINKCTGCVDRIEQGMEPACVTTCQPDALLFGDRDEMLMTAHERVGFLKRLGYEDASVYGESQVGGSHLIHVLKYPLDRYTLPEDPQTPAFVSITRVMKPLTGLAAAVTTLGLTLFYLLGIGYSRDTLAYNVETEDTLSVTTGEVVKHGDGQDEKSVMEHITENLPIELPVGKGKDKEGKEDKDE